MYMNVIKIREMLISCVKLDHTLYSINYGIQNSSSDGWEYCGSHKQLVVELCLPKML